MRTPIKEGREITLYSPSFDYEVMFQIKDCFAEGGSVLCYHAKMMDLNDDNAYTNGILKELYKENSKDYSRNNAGICTLKTKDSLEYAKYYSDIHKLFLQKKNEYPHLGLYVDDYQIFWGEKSNELHTGSVYLWTTSTAGITFEEYIQECHREPEKDTEIKIQNILTIIKNIAECCNAFHKSGLMQLDIKPDNFLVCEKISTDTKEKHIDPEIVKLIDLNSLEYENVASNGVFRSNYFSPPYKNEAVTPKWDVFSLGRTLYYALTRNYYTWNNKADKADIAAHLKNTSLLLRFSMQAELDNIIDQIATLIAQSTKQMSNSRIKVSEFVRQLNEIIRQLDENLNSLQLLGKKSKSTIIQNFLFSHPLYEYAHATGVESKNRHLNVMVYGFIDFGRLFTEYSFQVMQIPHYSILVDVYSNGYGNYLSKHKELEKFVQINGSTVENKLGDLRFYNNDRASITQQDIQYDFIFVTQTDEKLSEIVQFLNKIYPQATIAYLKINQNFDLECLEYTLPIDLTTDSYKENIKLLEKFAFKAHLVWEKRANIDLMTKLNEFRMNDYNYTSSMNYALSIPYKLKSIGIDFYSKTAIDDLTKILENPKDTRDVYTLALAEQNRWILEKIFDGWVAPKKLADCVANRCVKNSKEKTHPCIVSATESRHLVNNYTVSDWDVCSDKDSKLDGLDKMSVDLHRLFKVEAEEIRKHDFFNSSKAYKLLSESCAALNNQNVTVAFQDFQYCVQNILRGSKPYTKKFSSVCNKLINVSNHNPHIENLINNIGKELFAVTESNLYRNYKQNNVDFIKNLPFILSFDYEKPMKLAVAFNDTSDCAGVISSIASALTLSPNSLCFLYYIDERTKVGNFTAKFTQAVSFLKQRSYRGNISLMEVYNSNAEDKANCIKESLLSIVPNIEQVQVSMKPEDGEASFKEITERIKQAHISKLDRINQLFPNRFDDNFWAMAEKSLHVFCFKLSTGSFENGRELNYLKNDVSLNVNEAFSIRDAKSISRGEVSLQQSFERLWQIYTASRTDYKTSVETWNSFTSDLHDKLKDQEIVLGCKDIIKDSQLESEEFRLPYYSLDSVLDMLSVLKDNRVISEDSFCYSRQDFTCGVVVRSDKNVIDKIRNLFLNNSNYINKYNNFRVEVYTNGEVWAKYCTLQNTEYVDKKVNCTRSLPDFHRIIDQLAADHYIEIIDIKNAAKGEITFRCASYAVKELLTKGGNIFEQFVYYAALDTGYFDDVVWDYSFTFNNGSEQNELDIVLIKGFKMMIIECKATEKLDNTYFSKLKDIVNPFGAYTTGVLCWNNYKGKAANIEDTQGIKLIELNDSNRDKLGEILVGMFEDNN